MGSPSARFYLEANRLLRSEPSSPLSRHPNYELIFHPIFGSPVSVEKESALSELCLLVKLHNRPGNLCEGPTFITFEFRISSSDSLVQNLFFHYPRVCWPFTFRSIIHSKTKSQNLGLRVFHFDCKKGKLCISQCFKQKESLH